MNEWKSLFVERGVCDATTRHRKNKWKKTVRATLKRHEDFPSACNSLFIFIFLLIFYAAAQLSLCVTKPKSCFSCCCCLLPFPPAHWDGLIECGIIVVLIVDNGLYNSMWLRGLIPGPGTLGATTPISREQWVAQNALPKFLLSKCRSLLSLSPHRIPGLIKLKLIINLITLHWYTLDVHFSFVYFTAAHCQLEVNGKPFLLKEFFIVPRLPSGSSSSPFSRSKMADI